MKRRIELFSYLIEKTKSPIASVDELHTVRSSVLQLQNAGAARLASRWDVAKIASSILRCNFADDPSRSTDLLSLVELGFTVCSASACRRLASLVGSPHMTELLHAWPAVCTELQDDAEPSAALRVLLSLINIWHAIAARQRTLPWHIFCGFTSAVARGIAALAAAFPAEDALLNSYASYWLSAVITRGLEEASCLWPCARYLLDGLEQSPKEGEGESPAGDAAGAKDVLLPPLACVTSGLHAPPVVQLWRQLRTRLLRACREQLREYCAELHARWTADVVPALVCFQGDPGALAEDFNRPVAFANTSDSLCALRTGMTTTSSCAAEREEAVFARYTMVRQLARAMQRASPADLYDEVSAEEYQLCVRPAVIVALREGLLDIALRLLRWTSAVHDRGDWLRRLRGLAEESFSLPSADWTGLLPSADVVAAARVCPPLLQTFIKSTAEQLTAAVALDVLALSHDVAALRYVCDALFRVPTAAGREVLSDVFASPLIIRALARLIHALLDAGDAPLARCYINILTTCLMRCPSHVSLLIFLQAFGRLATVLSSDDWPTVQLPAGARAEWRAAARCLAGLLPPPPRGASPSRERQQVEHYRLGGAFAARVKSFQRMIAQPAGRGAAEAAPGHASFAAVTLRVTASGCVDVLRKERRRRPSGPDNSETEKAGDEEELCEWCAAASAGRQCRVRELVSRAVAVQQANRAQLLRGSGGRVACGEVARAESVSSADTAGVLAHSSPELSNKTVSSSTAPVAHEASSHKERWWAERFALDEDVYEIIKELEDDEAGLGYSRLLLLGSLPAAQRRLIEALSSQLMEQLHALLPALSDVAAGCSSRLQSVVYMLLHGLPFLYPTKVTRDGRAPRPVFTGVWFSAHHDHSTCAVCGQTASALAVRLRSALEEVWVYEVVRRRDRDGTPAEAESAVRDSFAGKELELHVLCAAVTVSAAHVFAELAAARGDEHADLLAVPRGHVYLVLDGPLHALPLEGMDVLRGGSASRVPSEDFVQQQLRHGPQHRSLQRVHIFADPTATRCWDWYEAQCAAHEGWTLQRDVAATNADEGTLIHGDSPLLLTLMRNKASIYLYIGHKRGEHIISRAQLYDRFPPQLLATDEDAGPQLPVVLLMSCSSARMSANMAYEAYGMPFAYLHAGAPCVVGCSWDVTDGDVDRLTQRFFEYASARAAAASGAAVTVGEALAHARRACKLPFLSAFATVMYGTNVSLSS